MGRSNISPFRRLLATGVLSYEGEKWAKHRRILNPAFHFEKLKVIHSFRWHFKHISNEFSAYSSCTSSCPLSGSQRMLPAFSVCCSDLVSRWEKLVGQEGSRELDVWPELQNFTGDVISRAAFGSSYEEGRRIFELQAEIAELIMQTGKTAVYVPGYRWAPLLFVFVGFQLIRWDMLYILIIVIGQAKLGYNFFKR